MSLVAILVFGAAFGPPAVAAPAAPAPALTDIADDRTPMRCKPAPYYVAEQGGERSKAERLLVTGSRVPLVARDYPERRGRPCFLMRYETPEPPCGPPTDLAAASARDAKEAVMIVLLAAAATIAATPPTFPPPTITIGMSCAEASAKMQSYRNKLPDGVEAPGPLITCRDRKVIAVEPYPSALFEFDGGMVIKPGPDPDGCKMVQQRVKDDEAVYFERLRGGRGHSAAIWLVERKVAGCGVTTPMGYHPTYLLPGAADKPPTPADAPPNKR